jgi:type I restriction enzyme S subunit
MADFHSSKHYPFIALFIMTTIPAKCPHAPAAQKKLECVARFNPHWRDDFAVPDMQVAYVTAPLLSAMSWEVWPERRRLGDIRRSFPAFADNDVLVANHWTMLQQGTAGMARLDATYPYGFCTSNMTVIRPDSQQLDARYLMYFLRQPQMDTLVEDYLALAADKRPLPTQAFLKNLLVPLPPLEQQRYWAVELDRAHQACADARRHLAGLARDRRNFFRDFFADTLAMRQSKAETALGAHLDVVILGTGAWAQYQVDQGHAVIRPSNLGDQQLLMENLLHVRLPWGVSRRARVHPGDVLIGTRATVGAAVAPKDVGVAYAGSGVAILRSTRLAPEFLAAFLCSSAGLGEIELAQITYRRPCLGIEALRTIRLVVPPLALQRRFVEESAHFDPGMRQARAQLTHAMACFAATARAAFDPGQHASEADSVNGLASMVTA